VPCLWKFFGRKVRHAPRRSVSVPKKWPEFQGVRIKSYPHSASAWLFTKSVVEALLFGLGSFEGALELNVADDAPAFENDIVPCAIDLGSEYFCVVNPALPQRLQALADKDVLKRLFPKR
jgi:hypothetical protein